MDVTCALTKNGEKITKIEDVKDGEIDNALSVDFVLPGGANLNLKLAGNTFQTMRVLLDQLCQQAGWGEVAMLSSNSPQELENFQTKSSKNTSIH